MVSVYGNAQCWNKVATISTHTAVIKYDGTLWAWGRNDEGQLGNGTTISCNSPIQVSDDTDWKEIAVGIFTSIAVKTDGSLWSWGSSTQGMLGRGVSNLVSHAPARIGNANDWSKVSASQYSAYAIKTDGTLWAWGHNVFGQLGNGQNSNKFIPVQVGTDTDWVEIKGGQAHVIALKNNGTLWGWGYNPWGQVGDGTYIDRNAPVQIGAANDWVFINTDSNTSTAIKADGTLWIWGNIYDSQLGNEAPMQHYNTPLQIGIGSIWKQSATSMFHSLMLTADGSLMAVGNNTYGQLGNGSNEIADELQQVGNQGEWASVYISQNFSFAQKTDGSLWGFGRNDFGQLGIGSNTDANIPVEVACTILDTDQLPAKIFSIYPNPAKNELYIHNPENKNIDNISVIDISGKEMAISLHPSKIDLSQLQKGLYIIRIYTDGGQYLQKFLKE